MAEQSRFFLTGSDFSELAVLESSMPNELNSTGRLMMDNSNQNESVLRAANFKKLDLDAIETNLI